MQCSIKYNEYPILSRKSGIAVSSFGKKEYHISSLLKTPYGISFTLPKEALFFVVCEAVYRQAFPNINPPKVGLTQEGG